MSLWLLLRCLVLEFFMVFSFLSAETAVLSFLIAVVLLVDYPFVSELIETKGRMSFWKYAAMLTIPLLVLFAVGGLFYFLDSSEKKGRDEKRSNPNERAQ